MRDVIALQVAELLERQQWHLQRFSSFSELEHWRDALVEHNALHNGAYGCLLGSLASELAGQDKEDPSARHFKACEELLANGLHRMKESGVLRPEADIETLTTGLMAALQGGYLLAQTHRDVNPMKIALDMAIAHVRTYMVAPGDRAPEDGKDVRQPQRPQ